MLIFADCVAPLRMMVLCFCSFRDLYWWNTELLELSLSNYRKVHKRDEFSVLSVPSVAEERFLI